MENDIDNLFKESINIDKIGKYDTFFSFDPQDDILLFQSDGLVEHELTKKRRLASLEKVKIFLEMSKKEKIDKSIKDIAFEFRKKIDSVDFAIKKLEAIIFLEKFCNFTVKPNSSEESSTSSESKD